MKEQLLGLLKIKTPVRLMFFMFGTSTMPYASLKFPLMLLFALALKLRNSGVSSRDHDEIMEHLVDLRIQVHRFTSHNRFLPNEISVFLSRRLRELVD